MIQVLTRDNLGVDFDTAGAITSGKVNVKRATLSTYGVVRLSDIYSPSSPVALPIGSTAEGTVIGANTPAAGSFSVLTVTSQATFQAAVLAPNKLTVLSQAVTLNGATHNAAGTDYAIGVNTVGSTSGSYDLNRNNSNRGFFKLTNSDDLQLGTPIAKSVDVITSGASRINVAANGVTTLKSPVIAESTINGVAPALSDNSTAFVTSAWVKSQGYHSSAGLTTFTSLTVTADTRLGQSSSDDFTVSATSTFESPAYFLQPAHLTAPSLLDNSDKAVSSAWVKSQGYGASGTSLALGASSTLDLSGSIRLFQKVIAANTEFLVTNVPDPGIVCFFLLDLTNAGAFSFTGSWWNAVKWQGGLPPTLTASGRDLLGFLTYDGGVTWTGSRLLGDIS